MRRFGSSILSVIIAAIMCLQLAPVSAQPLETDTTFASALSGSEISLGSSGDLVFLPDQYSVIENDSFAEEYIWFSGGSSNFELIFIQGETEPTEYMEVTLDNMLSFYESFEIIESGSTRSESWFLGNAVYEGRSLVVNFEYERDAIDDIDFAVMQFSEPEYLGDDILLVQDNATIDGEPILADTDARALQALVDANPGSTPVSTNISETGGDATPTADTSWESMGLISDTEWESPTYGSSVTWDAETWAFPRDMDDAIYLADSGFDVITIETTDGMGYAFVTIDEQYSTDPAVTVEYWMSDEYMQGMGEATILDSATTSTTASVVFQTVDAKDLPIIVVMEASFEDDGTAVYAQISAAPETIGDVYSQFEEGVQINGAPFNLTWSADEIADIAGQ